MISDRHLAFEKLERIMKNAHEVMVTFNDHRGGYQTVAEYLERAEASDEEIHPLVRQEAILRNELVCIQIYPDTPIGFFRVYHWHLKGALDALEL